VSVVGGWDSCIDRLVYAMRGRMSWNAFGRRKRLTLFDIREAAPSQLAVGGRGERMLEWVALAVEGFWKVAVLGEALVWRR
jgi:hypothetical protein